MMGASTTAAGRVALTAVPQVHPEAGVQKVGGRWMAVTLDDKLHTFEEAAGVVSEVGERIIELVDGRRTVAGIVEALVEEFEVSRPVCEADTVQFIGKLVEKQVLVLR